MITGGIEIKQLWKICLKLEPTFAEAHLEVSA